MTAPTTMKFQVIDFILGKTIRQVYVRGSTFDFKEGDPAFTEDYGFTVYKGGEVVILEFTDDTVFYFGTRIRLL